MLSEKKVKMPGTIVENLSNKKLSILTAIILICQLTCFLVGFISPSPAKTQGILATVCVDDNDKPDVMKDHDRWFTRDCKKAIDLNNLKSTENLDSHNLVFVVQMPNFNYDFSRWQQNLVGVLQIDVVYGGMKVLEGVTELTLDARLAYSEKLPNNKRTPWKMYAYAEEKRYMDCSFFDEVTEELQGYPYNCSMVPLFELGALYHDYYLLNMRLVYNETLNKNTKLDRISDIYLHIIHMNGGFTKVWVSMKTIFFPIIIAILVWFWKRVHSLSRKPALLECMLLFLGGSLALLNLPIEYLTLYFNMPYMLVLSDIRQGIFYATLLSFWLVFAGEHMLVQDNGEKNSIKLYWKHLSTIVISCLMLLIFDLSERGVQLVNPFYSIWVTPVGANLALSFIILAGISASIYFIFLCHMLWQVFKNIRVRRSILPSMSHARRLHYEGIIYRFNFLMMATVICAALTILSFILSQVVEGQNKWDENMDVDLVSPFHTGVYGMWNVYIFSMLILYAPSHKQWPVEPTGNEGEEVEFSRLPTDPSPNEISSLTSFTSKANIE